MRGGDVELEGDLAIAGTDLATAELEKDVGLLGRRGLVVDLCARRQRRHFGLRRLAGHDLDDRAGVEGGVGRPGFRLGTFGAGCVHQKASLARSGNVDVLTRRNLDDCPHVRRDREEQREDDQHHLHDRADGAADHQQRAGGQCAGPGLQPFGDELLGVGRIEVEVLSRPFERPADTGDGRDRGQPLDAGLDVIGGARQLPDDRNRDERRRQQDQDHHQQRGRDRRKTGIRDAQADPAVHRVEHHREHRRPEDHRRERLHHQPAHIECDGERDRERDDPGHRVYCLTTLT